MPPFADAPSGGAPDTRENEIETDAGNQSDRGPLSRDFDPFGTGDSERVCRATGGNDFSDLSDRATGRSERLGDNNRESPFDSGARDNPFRLFGDRVDDHHFHLSDESPKPQESPFSLGDFDLTDRAQPGERATDWLGLDSPDPRSTFDALDFVGGIADFIRNYFEMKATGPAAARAGIQDWDKLFHCLANCEATQRGVGGEAAAYILSGLREYPMGVISNALKGYSWEKSKADINNDFHANRVGRETARSGERCFDPCRRLIH